MNDQPQPIDLDAIEARTTAATPAPWGYYDGGDYADVAAGYTPTGPGSYTCTQSIARIEADEYEAEDDDEAADQMRADAEFITHARADVPALLAEIRRLTTELDRLQAAPAVRPTGRPAELCDLPHPVAPDTWCELRIEHAGWHQDEHGDKWPNTLLPGRPAAACPCDDPACGPCSFDRAIPPTTDPAAVSGA